MLLPKKENNIDAHIYMEVLTQLNFYNLNCLCNLLTFLYLDVIYELLTQLNFG